MGRHQLKEPAVEHGEVALGTAQERQVRVKELGDWVWGKQIKGWEIRSEKGARYKDFGWKDRALYLREPRAKRGGKSWFFQPYSCLCLTSTNPGSPHSFLLSPFYMYVCMCVHAQCA